MSEEVDQDTLISEAGDMLAGAVLGHIDTMYPAMWKAVSKSARMSIRNTIRRHFASEFDELLRELSNGGS